MVWEDTIAKDQDPVRGTLNPSCCQQAKSFFVWPFYIFSIHVLFVTISLLVLVCSNIYLSEVSKHINTSNHKIELLDIVALALILCLCIGFGCYFLFRPTENNFNTNPNSMSNGELKANQNFEIVPRNIVNQNSAPLKAVYSYTNTTAP